MTADPIAVPSSELVTSWLGNYQLMMAMYIDIRMYQKAKDSARQNRMFFDILITLLHGYYFHSQPRWDLCPKLWRELLSTEHWALEHVVLTILCWLPVDRLMIEVPLFDWHNIVYIWHYILDYSMQAFGRHVADWHFAIKETSGTSRKDCHQQNWKASKITIIPPFNFERLHLPPLERFHIERWVCFRERWVVESQEQLSLKELDGFDLFLGNSAVEHKISKLHGIGVCRRLPGE